MVDVDHIVSDVETHQVVDGQPLGRGYFAAHLYLVVAFEYLMVGVIAVFGHAVHISLVQREVQECRGDKSLRRRELPQHLLHTENLVGIDRKDVDFITLALLLGDVPHKYLEILVEDRLRLRLDLLRHKVLFISAAAQLLLHIVVLHPDYGLRGQHILYSHIVLLFEVLIKVGAYLHLLQAVGAALAVDIEMSYALHLVAEEIHPVGTVVGERENIYDGAAKRKFARSGDEIRPGEADALQQFLEDLVTDALADAD